MANFLLFLQTKPNFCCMLAWARICRCFKGTVSRDFLLLVFFMNQFPPSSRVFHLDRFEFFRKFAEIFASQGAPPVSTTPVANLPPVSRQTLQTVNIKRRLQRIQNVHWTLYRKGKEIRKRDIYLILSLFLLFLGRGFNSWILNDICRNFLLGSRKKIAKCSTRTFTCRSTFLYADTELPDFIQEERLAEAAQRFCAAQSFSAHCMYMLRKCFILSVVFNWCVQIFVCRFWAA